MILEQWCLFSHKEGDIDMMLMKSEMLLGNTFSHNKDKCHGNGIMSEAVAQDYNNNETLKSSRNKLWSHTT